jgi:hypothetical protein
MRFSVKTDLTATLPEDREPVLQFDFEGDTVLTHKPYGVHFGPTMPRLDMRHLNVWSCWQSKTRVGRFYVFAKAAWRASK